MMKLLIVEDSQALSQNISTYLTKEGYVCEQAFNYFEAIDKLAVFRYDIVVLDIMLPDGNGLDVLHAIRDLETRPGVLIISAKNSLDDRVRGLDLGADDYLTKPFHLSELNARLKAIHRRRHFEGRREIVFNEIRVNTDTLEVKVHDQLLNLTRKEYELLLFFLANKNRVLTKQTIAEHLWGDHMDFSDNFDFVYQHIKNLRKKLTAAGGEDYLTNIYGVGYRFNEIAKR
jgi:DNA-binding response OmpR family regulator